MRLEAGQGNPFPRLNTPLWPPEFRWVGMTLFWDDFPECSRNSWVIGEPPKHSEFHQSFKVCKFSTLGLPCPAITRNMGNSTLPFQGPQIHRCVSLRWAPSPINWCFWEYQSAAHSNIFLCWLNMLKTKAQFQGVNNITHESIWIHLNPLESIWIQWTCSHNHKPIRCRGVSTLNFFLWPRACHARFTWLPFWPTRKSPVWLPGGPPNHQGWTRVGI